MTRKEMIIACVDNQIERGIIKAENRSEHINMRLNSKSRFYMTVKATKEWYAAVFN